MLSERTMEAETAGCVAEGSKKMRKFPHVTAERSTGSYLASRKHSCAEINASGSRQEALDTLARIHAGDDRTPAESRLLAFNDEILCMLWPAESVVAGQLVNKKLRLVLALARRVKFHLNPRSIRRLQQQVTGNSRVAMEKIVEDIGRFSAAEIDFHFEDYQQPYCLNYSEDENHGQPLPSKQARIAVKALKKVASLGGKIRGVSFVGVPEDLLRDLHNLGQRPGRQQRLPLQRVDLSNAGRMCKHATKSLNVLKCSSLTELKLSGVHFWPGPLRLLGESLAQCPALESLNLSDSALPPAWKFASSSSSFWKNVCALPNLRQLHLANVAFNGHDAVLERHISRLQPLRHLSLSRTDRSSFDFHGLLAGIAHLRALTHVDLSSAATVRQDLAASLAAAVAQWPELRHLALSGWELEESGEGWALLLGALGRGCRELRVLDLARSHRGAPASGPLPARALAEQLARWPRLATLDIRGRVAADAGGDGGVLGAALAQAPDLRSLAASVALGGLAAHCPGLAHLELSGPELRDHVGRVVAELPGLRWLKALTLRSCGLSDAAALAAALPRLPLLSKLDLSLNPLGPRGVGQLAEGLAACCKLETLVMMEVAAGRGGAEALGRVLASLPRLTRLNLRRNNLPPAAVAALCEQLPEQLAHLDLSGNAIGADGYRCLERVLAAAPDLVSAQLHNAAAEHPAAQPPAERVAVREGEEEEEAAREGVTEALCTAARLRVLRVDGADASGEAWDWVPESSEDGMDEADWDDVTAYDAEAEEGAHEVPVYHPVPGWGFS